MMMRVVIGLRGEMSAARRRCACPFFLFVRYCPAVVSASRSASGAVSRFVVFVAGGDFSSSFFVVVDLGRRRLVKDLWALLSSFCWAAANYFIWDYRALLDLSLPSAS